MTGSAPPQPEDDADDAPIDLSDLRWEDGLVLLVFWALFAVVFLQFFTRYVLNDSLGWTEEIARFLLIGVTFIGVVTAVRKEGHIAVEIFYRWMPRALRRIGQTFVDVASILFYGAMAVTCARLAQRTKQKMVSIDVPKSLVYWGVAACFAVMFLLAIWLLIKHLRSADGPLVDPDKRAETAPSLE